MYPTFSALHRKDNVQSSRTIQNNHRCIFNVNHEKLETLKNIHAAIIFDISIQNGRFVYYVYAEYLKLVLDYYRLKSQQGCNYAIAINPLTGDVHNPNYTMCNHSCNEILFTLNRLSPEQYDNYYIKLTEVEITKWENRWKSLLDNESASYITTPEEKFQQLLEDCSHTSELNLLLSSRHLCNLGVDVNRVLIENKTLLHKVAACGCSAFFNWLLTRKVNVNEKDLKGRTPLHVAVCNGQLKNTRALLKARANPDIVDAKGNSPVMYTLLAQNLDLQTRRSMIQSLMPYETIIATEKVDIKPFLIPLILNGDLSVELVSEYCLPLKDMILISQEIRAKRPQDYPLFHEKMNEWSYNRASLYQRIWCKKLNEELKQALESDSVSLRNGQIVKNNSFLRKIKFLNGNDLISQVEYDFDMDKTDGDSVQLVRNYIQQIM